MQSVIMAALLQITPEAASSWERVGIVGFLVVGIGAVYFMYRQKVGECDKERIRADAAEQKYVDVLIADIEERKARDQTLELLSRVARGKGTGNGE